MTDTSAVEFLDMPGGDMRGLICRQSDTIAALRAKLATVEDERDALTAEIATQVGYKNDYKAAYAECVENHHTFRARITQENNNE
jgi:hypothetical protein